MAGGVQVFVVFSFFFLKKTKTVRYNGTMEIENAQLFNMVFPHDGTIIEEPLRRFFHFFLVWWCGCADVLLVVGGVVLLYYFYLHYYIYYIKYR